MAAACLFTSIRTPSIMVTPELIPIEMTAALLSLKQDGRP